MQELLTPEEVAKMLKVDRRTVYYWIEQKKINHIRINRKVIRFRLYDVEEFLQKHVVQADNTDSIVDEIMARIS